jgi:hypothetical protein
LDINTFANLHQVGEKLRALILQSQLPDSLTGK